MKLHYMGKFDGKESSLPAREHPDGYRPFKEPRYKAFVVIVNAIALLISMACIMIMLFLDNQCFDEDKTFQIIIGIALSAIVLFPHEMLHAICFKKDVYLYTNISKGMLFVTGIEDFCKGQFIFMCMLPNIIFGFVPFAAFLLNNKLVWCGVMGAICIGSGAGDYMNVLNAIFQVPKDGRIYGSGLHSFWYIPMVSNNALDVNK